MAGQATKSGRNKSRNSAGGEHYLPEHLAFELARVVEQAALAAARTMGQGDRPGSDHAAVEAMRRAFEDVPIAGNIVIGEGERDEAPMLYIGERVGAAPPAGIDYPAVDIAVDPLEGTNLCATGANNSIAVLAASEAGGLLHAPDCYMEKIIAGPGCQGVLDLDAPPLDNLKAIASQLDRDVDDLVVMVLDRPRHEQLIADIRKAGARIRLIGDGDLSAGISAAIRARGCTPSWAPAARPKASSPLPPCAACTAPCSAGWWSKTRKWSAAWSAWAFATPTRSTPPATAPGKKIIFTACGVTPGNLLQGVRFFGGGYRTHSLVMTSEPNTVSFRDTVHLIDKPDRRGVRLF